MRAQEAALKETANSKLRRLLAYNKSFSCADIAVGDTLLLYKTSPPGKARHVGADQQKFWTSTKEASLFKSRANPSTWSATAYARNWDRRK